MTVATRIPTFSTIGDSLRSDSIDIVRIMTLFFVSFGVFKEYMKCFSCINHGVHLKMSPYTSCWEVMSGLMNTFLPKCIILMMMIQIWTVLLLL